MKLFMYRHTFVSKREITSKMFSDYFGKVAKELYIYRPYSFLLFHIWMKTRSNNKAGV
jgi:hypothetical protein